MNGKIGDCRNFLLPPSKEATIASFQLVDAILRGGSFTRRRFGRIGGAKQLR